MTKTNFRLDIEISEQLGLELYSQWESNPAAWRQVFIEQLAFGRPIEIEDALGHLFDSLFEQLKLKKEAWLKQQIELAIELNSAEIFPKPRPSLNIVRARVGLEPRSGYIFSQGRIAIAIDYNWPHHGHPDVLQKLYVI